MKGISQTFISLIPKVDNLEYVKQFRPISPCNVAYKVVTKIIANRIKRIMSTVIALTQCGFIHGRTRSNNAIIAQEIIHYMRTYKGTNGLMAIKIDLKKAYDRQSWHFVVVSLRDLGLKEDFVNLVWNCVSTASINIFWNGESTGNFLPCRGIRQGDPLSLLIFLFFLQSGYLI